MEAVAARKTLNLYLDVTDVSVMNLKVPVAASETLNRYQNVGVTEAASKTLNRKRCVRFDVSGTPSTCPTGLLP